MTFRMRNFLRRFRKNEDGQFLVEFAIVVPLVFTIFMTAVELGIYSMRQLWLDRGLDMAVRDVRVGTDDDIEHDDLKEMICEYAGGFLPDCEDSLLLEMRPDDPRAFVGFTGPVQCIDRAEPIEDLEEDRLYVEGREHDLMIVRACLSFDPIFPTTGLGFHMKKDGSGQAQMFATSAFVQEPGIWDD